MKNGIILPLSVFSLLLTGCKTAKDEVTYHLPEWLSRKTPAVVTDSLKHHHVYLPVYAQIYSITENHITDLVATISIRNTDTKDSIYLNKIDYYNTSGQLIRHYISAPVFIKPSETVEIIIKNSDNAGGSGANFIFEWAAKVDTEKPLFESIMISTAGQQGISFTSRGVDLNK